MVMIHDAARMSRQEEIIAPQLRRSVIFIAGCGMLGSWSALALSRVARHVILFDHDTVEDVNAGNQAYNALHDGMTKVSALASLAYGLPVTPVEGVFPLERTPADLIEPLALDEPSPYVLVSAVDSMETRRALANWAHHHNVGTFVDTRAMAEIAVVCIVPHARIPHYLAHECPPDDETPDMPCGLHGTAYVGMNVGAIVAARLNAMYAGKPVPFIQVTDVSTGDVLRSEA